MKDVTAPQQSHVMMFTRDIQPQDHGVQARVNEDREIRSASSSSRSLNKYLEEAVLFRPLRWFDTVPALLALALIEIVSGYSFSVLSLPSIVLALNIRALAGYSFLLANLVYRTPHYV